MKDPYFIITLIIMLLFIPAAYGMMTILANPQSVRKLKTTAWFIVAAMLPLAVLAQYDETGYSSNTFEGASGGFSEALVDSIVARGVGTARIPPLVSNLDNDNLTEIIVFDGSSVGIHQNSSLTTIDTLNLPGASSVLSNAIAFDIDGDGFKEIIVADMDGAVEEVFIMNYSNSNLQLQSSFNYSQLDHDDGAGVAGEIAIKCRAVQDCAMIVADTTAGNNNGNISLATFNTSGIVDHVGVKQGVTVSQVCLPKIRYLASGDILNDDGVDEYIWTYADFETMYLGTAQVSTSLIIGTLDQRTITDYDAGSIVASNTCEDEVGVFDQTISGSFTAPTVAQTLGAGTPEIIVGFMKSDNDFRVHVYDGNLNFKDDFPEVSDSEGLLISNVFIGKFFPDSAGKDFCVVGYNDEDPSPLDDDLTIQITCGSRTTAESPQTNTYEVDIDAYETPFNVSSTYLTWHTIAHSSNHDTENSFTCGLLNCNDNPGADLDEVVSAYGLIKLKHSGTGCAATGSCDGEIQFQHGKGSGAMIPANADGNGFDDLLLQTDNNLFYFDDAFQNGGGKISSYEINPCLDSPWKVNTTAFISIEVTDPENDQVQSAASLYDGLPGQKSDNFTSTFNSGTTFTFAFLADQLATNAPLKLSGRDVVNPAVVDELELSFSVAENGVENGDCKTTVEGLVSVSVNTSQTVAQSLTANETEKDVVLGNNIRQDIDSTFPFSATVIFLMIMAIVAGVIWVGSPFTEKQPKATLGVIVFIEVVILLISQRLGLIDGSIILIIFLLGILVLGTLSVRAIFGQTSSS